MTRIYKTPFATTGDKETLASASQPDGKVSLPDGFTSVYELESSNPSYKPVGRGEMNGIFNEITAAVGELQTQGGIIRWQVVEGGFNKGAIVYGADMQTLWQSNVDSNTTDPDSAEAAGWARFGGLKTINTIVMTSSGTYTPTPGTQFIIVEGVGGGGAGGGASVTTANNTSIGSGGGSGGYCKSRIDISDLGESVAVTVGSGGSGVSGGSGGHGSSTKFGRFFTSYGGYGGQKAGQANASFGTSGGAFGGASGGSILSIPGERGGNAFTTYPSFTFAGQGGSCNLGSGGMDSTSGNGIPGSGYGAGGGGTSVSGGSVGTYSGGAGAPGVVIITEYIF